MTIGASIRLVRVLAPALPALSRSAAARTMLLAQLSARPWELHPEVVATELKSFAATPTFDAFVRDLAAGPGQNGPAAPTSGPVTIGWGPAGPALPSPPSGKGRGRLPISRLHWFDKCGHFPMWDRPEETVELIMSNTG